MTTINNLDLPPEEKRRQGFFVAIQQEAPERILHYLVDIVDNEDWQRYGFTNIVQYIETPYDKGGIGWTRKNLKTMIHLDHRQEWDKHTRKDEYFLGRLRNARETVARAIGEEVPTLNPNGGDRSSLIYQTEKPTDKGGTSRDYIIARLKRDAPDIAEQVISQEISAAEGMRRLKERQPKPRPDKVTVNMADVESVAKQIRHYMNSDQIVELIAHLLDDQG